MKKYIILFLICFYFNSIFAQESEIKIRLENCKISKESIRKIKESFDFQLLFYEEVFQKPYGQTFYARIFCNENDYYTYSKKIANFNALRENAAAFYSPRLNEMVLHANLGSFERIFSHELNHALIANYRKSIPDWLNEGLSEFFEKIIYQDGKYIIGDLFFEDVEKIKGYIIDGADIGKVIKSNYKGFHGIYELQNYRLAEAVVAYLYLKKISFLKKMIKELDDDIILYIDSNYPGGLSFLEADVKSYYFNYHP